MSPVPPLFLPRVRYRTSRANDVRELRRRLRRRRGRFPWFARRFLAGFRSRGVSARLAVFYYLGVMLARVPSDFFE